jgi:hypothetical protein
VVLKIHHVEADGEHVREDGVLVLEELFAVGVGVGLIDFLFDCHVDEAIPEIETLPDG